MKYIKVTTSANFGNMISMAMASMFLPFLPLLAKQILMNNFLSSLPGMAIASDAVDDEMVGQPRRWNIPELRNFMLVLGLISTAFDLITFGILLFVFEAPAELFRTGWFVESLLTQLLIMLIVRTQRPLWRSRPGTLLLYSTLAVAGLALAIPYLPGAHLLGFVRLPFPLMAAIIVITLAYTTASELGKHFVAHRAPSFATALKRNKTL